ncbi:MAG: activase [Verrucomicrobia bacterium]|nr:activase [Verrucomicrobiota bacterium]
MRTLGICLGATTLSLVEAERGSDKAKAVVCPIAVVAHEGNPRRALAEALGTLDMNRYDRVAATGRKFRHFLRLSSITESEAGEIALAHVHGSGERLVALVSAGGETFMVYALDAHGKIAGVHTGNKCASGTGEFFLQQIRRMDLGLDEAVALSRGSEPHKISGRCSVFCKSDCTHALNHGEPKGRVVAGLSRMMARKIGELLVKLPEGPVMVVGGVAQNGVVMDFLRDERPDLFVPDEAPYFEAVGAALWALDSETIPYPGVDELVIRGKSAFDFLAPLRRAESRVSFKPSVRGSARAGDECIIGLDVGSTTTKAVVLRTADNAILASVYLRTNGDPVGASRQCYAGLTEQINVPVDICGLGVTGSGRQIAGLHALTDGIVNEIIAHATAAAYFDPAVDTIFEIGGQDAKYTYLTDGVPSDYAMNEACSAGTGSFLEEAAKESLGLDVTAIADIAMRAGHPPNFNDQCAAFISSDIKNAAHEGIERDDIVAGLVYSICMNYTNRVKGNRPVGQKIFMQGGVCYNRAVPVAMAALVGKPIIVPPDPGLMGAFGVALEIKARQEAGLLSRQAFDLRQLAAREVAYKKPFTCRGGADKCDRRCEINRLVIEGKTYPFGGACNKYYNLRFHIDTDTAALDLVAERQRLLFDTHAAQTPRAVGSMKGVKTIGINRSFMTHTLFPLYSHFFTELGFSVVLPDASLEEGCERRGAAFCYPAELAHGMFEALLAKRPDFVFMPLVIEMHVADDAPYKKLCPFAQSEPFYLRTAFGLDGHAPELLTPTLNFSEGFRSQRNAFAGIGRRLGVSRRRALDAYERACEAMEACQQAMHAAGRRVLDEIEADPEAVAVVLFGRPYNAFAGEANMGIPHKFASRGVRIVPLDFLGFLDEDCPDTMYWAMGRQNLKVARFVARHPQLFGVFITNFSCGPDSFLLTFFRDLMEGKPSLTLELDSHTADAGLNTRIEAFLDVVARHRELERTGRTIGVTRPFTPAHALVEGSDLVVQTSMGERLDARDPRVHMLLPSMGTLGTQALAAAVRSLGIRATALQPADTEALKLGRGATNCKECLPLQLTVGSLLDYVAHQRRDGEVLIYFMPESTGPCRFGQYNVFIKRLIEQERIPDLCVVPLGDGNGYSGLGPKFAYRAWQAVVASDTMNEVRSAVQVLAEDGPAGLAVFDEAWRLVLRALARENGASVGEAVKQAAALLQTIPRTGDVADAPAVLLTGEIFVRHDELSCQRLTDRLAAKGFITRTSPIGEFLYYVDHIYRHGLSKEHQTFADRLRLTLRPIMQRAVERRYKRALARSGFYHTELVEIGRVVDAGSRLMDPRFLGEAVLTVGSAVREIVHTVCGVISIGPFGCMPSRIAEAILSETMHTARLPETDHTGALLARLGYTGSLPFLAIETDGSAFPQLVEARLEAFCLQARRLHDRLQATENART